MICGPVTRGPVSTSHSASGFIRSRFAGFGEMRPRPADTRRWRHTSQASHTRSGDMANARRLDAAAERCPSCRALRRRRSMMPGSIARWPSRSPSQPTRVPAGSSVQRRPCPTRRSRTRRAGRRATAARRRRSRPACRAASRRRPRVRPIGPSVASCGEVPVALGTARHAPLAGPKAEDVVPRRRVAQRAHVVAAVGDGQHVRRQRDGRAAAAAAGRSGEVERVARRAEHVVERVRPETELGHVGLADDDAAGGLHALDHQRSRSRARSARASGEPIVIAQALGRRRDP